jgi:hypothetical protein
VAGGICRRTAECSRAWLAVGGARYNRPTKGGEHMAKGTGMRKEKKKPKKKK